MLHFRGHIVLIVFGKYLFCPEQPIGPELALGHHPFTFTKQVRQYSRITDRYHFGGIGHNEFHRKPITLALHTAGLHHASDAKRPLLGRSEEHTSEIQSLMRISYAVSCLK